MQARTILHVRCCACGQVAQMVERGPEKAGVGGSIPSLATIESSIYGASISGLAIAPNCPSVTAPFLG